jgi:predicted nucleotide-binding protein (sugar kinase/HSP70/actin superfamily)
MFFQELMPFFRAFFEDLGFTVVYSQKTNKSVINQGVEALAAEPCYPVKVAHGHLLDLLNAGVVDNVIAFLEGRPQNVVT